MPVLRSELLPVRTAELARRDRVVRTTRDWALLLSALLATSAALIHLSATIDHISEYWAFAAFFAILAPVQLGWAWAILTRASPALLRFGCALNAAVVCVWALSRTVGMPIGPDPWRAEGIGVLDMLATYDEVAIVVLLALVCRDAGAQSSSRPRLLRATIAAAPLLIAASLIAFVMGAHAH